MPTRRFSGFGLAALLLTLGACGRDEPARVEPGPTQTPPAEPARAAATETEQEAAQTIRRRLVDATAQAPEWSPEIRIEPEASVSERLQQADAAFAAGRLLEGENSALGVYLSILQVEPRQAEAEAGVDRVVEALPARVAALIDAGELDSAALYLSTLKRMRPGHASRQDLENRLEAQRAITLLLGEAGRLLDAGQLIEPPGENAAALYRAVLREAPGHAEAETGLARVESALIARAAVAAEAGKYDESDRLLAEAGRLRPGSQRVQNASTRIVELRQDRAMQLLAEGLAAVDAGELKAADRTLEALERVSAQAQGLDELRERIENARIYAGKRPGLAFSDRLADGSEGPTLVVIPVGGFEMGSPPGEAERKPNEGPLRSVTFARGFALGRNELSVGEFARFVAASGYVPTAQAARRSTAYDERNGSLAERRGVDWHDDYAGAKADDNLPVVHVSFEDAAAYVAWLSRQTGKRYRLPSEAEFEYVLRAGSAARYPWGEGNPARVLANLTGDGDRSPSRRTWANAFPSYGDGFWGPAPVGSFEPNAFGVHDIAGNVSEWTEDCWHDSYARGPVDGSAWVNPGCARRVIRGGSWASSPDQVRSAFRLTAVPGATNARVGIRIARDL